MHYVACCLARFPARRFSYVIYHVAIPPGSHFHDALGGLLSHPLPARRLLYMMHHVAVPPDSHFHDALDGLLSCSPPRPPPFIRDTSGGCPALTADASA